MGQGLSNELEAASASQSYSVRLQALSDEQLHTECQGKLWFSQQLIRDSASPYHAQCQELLEECQRRQKPNIFCMAQHTVRLSSKGTEPTRKESLASSVHPLDRRSDRRVSGTPHPTQEGEPDSTDSPSSGWVRRLLRSRTV